ncbi:MAG: hypothetical protein JW850_18670 [Thermoflexales bacterium]|nr:hypothetical protein [Thermoflexales bacterium]
MSKHKRWLIFLLIGLGAIFLLAGLLVAWLVPALSSGQAKRIAAMTPSTMAVLQDTLAGSEVLVEGRLSDDNPVLLDSYVVYVVYECYRDSEGDRECARIREVTPPLLLALPDGTLDITNDSYEWIGTKHLVGEGDTEYGGIQVGDPVLAVGILSSVEPYPQIEAKYIALGTQAELVASLRGQSVFWRVFGVAFVIIGLSLALAGAIVAARRQASSF